MKRIKVVDALMGSGKTSWAFEKINRDLDSNSNHPYIYVTPYLDEIDRMIKDTRGRFVQPENKGAGKRENLKRLLGDGCNIATTHVLFQYMDDECRELIRQRGYILILDEVLEAVTVYDLKSDMRDAIQFLLKKEVIRVTDDNYIEWIDREFDNIGGEYKEIRNMADSHCLMWVMDKILVWQYPHETFGLFSEVYILTYLFEGSILKKYFDLYGIGYEKFSIRKNNNSHELVKWFKPYTKHFKKLITIYEDKRSEGRAQSTATYSYKWYENNYRKDGFEALKKSIRNFYDNTKKRKGITPDNFMWCCFEGEKTETKKTYKPYKKSKDPNADIIPPGKWRKKLKGNGFKDDNCFCSFNMRATNKFSDRSILAYCVNRYSNPNINHYFREIGSKRGKNIAVNEDLYALSEMIQWVWRSSIRKGKAIEIYIPSKRMESLFRKWLNGEIV